MLKVIFKALTLLDVLACHKKGPFDKKYNTTREVNNSNQLNTLVDS